MQRQITYFLISICPSVTSRSGNSVQSVAYFRGLTGWGVEYLRGVVHGKETGGEDRQPWTKVVGLK